MLRRAKHAHARDRVIAREDHHLDTLRRLAIDRRLLRTLRRVIESQQFFDQRKRHARFGRHVEPFQLQLHVSRIALGAIEQRLRHAFFKDAVFFFKVKQRPRGNGHHQLSV